MIALLVFHVPFAAVVTVLMAAVCLAWLVALVTFPWNVYFHAKEVLFEIRRSREKGIVVAAEREEEARGVERRMLAFCVVAHLASAFLVAVAAWLSGERAGYVFSAFYLLSTFFRPAAAYYRYLRERLGQILDEVRWPLPDVASLRDRVTTLEAKVERAEERLRDLGVTADVDRTAAMSRADALDRKLTTVARGFEESLHKLTDNREVIAGIKAFLRLVRADHP